jgi:hypothetical protein
MRSSARPIAPPRHASYSDLLGCLGQRARGSRRPPRRRRISKILRGRTRWARNAVSFVHPSLAMTSTITRKWLSHPSTPHPLSHAVLPCPRRPRRTAFRTHPPANCVRCRHRRSPPATAVTCLRRVAKQVSLCNNYTLCVITTRMASVPGEAIITGPTILSMMLTIREHEATARLQDMSASAPPHSLL